MREGDWRWPAGVVPRISFWMDRLSRTGLEGAILRADAFRKWKPHSLPRALRRIALHGSATDAIEAPANKPAAVHGGRIEVFLGRWSGTSVLCAQAAGLFRGRGGRG